MAGFLFRLETEDGAPAEPRQLASVVPNWGVGDTIHLGKRTLRVIGKRDDDADQPPVLIVEDQRPRGLCPMRRNRLNRVPLKGAYGIRTRAAAVRGRCPRPLDECARRRAV